MGDIATAYVQIVPSARGMKKMLSDIFGNEMPSAGKSAGNLLGSSLVGTLKRVLAAAGIGEALKKTLTEGAALQQSLGGVETQFKDSAATVIANAQQAYKTAGMSANGYMEQVTSSSASLLQSLSGDTAKAASVADMALTDMSDNANKFGTDMDRITDAYQGFAKQNYTMLDNLKLGYGGTKTEMQRLLADAQKLTGVKYDINNLSDVYSAIHAVQGELGISGRTAEEVAEIAKNTGRIVAEQLGATAVEGTKTLSGSFDSMKAAFTNVLGNLALGQAMGPSLNALAETTVTFLRGNLAPAIKNVVTTLPGALGSFLSSVLPANMTNTAVSMVNNLATGLDSSIPQLLNRALPMITEFTGNLRSNAGMLADAGISLIMNLGRGIINSIPSLVENIPQIITNICGIINDNAPKLLMAGIELIWELGKGIIQAGPAILENFPAIIKSIMSVFSAANWISMGSNVVKAIGNGMKVAAPSNVFSTVQNLISNFTNSLKTHLPTIVQNGTQTIINFVQGFFQGLPNFISSVSSILQNFPSLVRGILPTIISNGAAIISNLVTGLISAIPNLLAAACTLLKQFLSTFVNALPSLMANGAKMIANVVSGIISNLPAVVSSGTTVISQLLSTLASHLPDLLAQGISLVGQLVAGLISMIPDIITSAGNIAKNICDTIADTDWLSIGSNIISGIASGIKNGVSSIISAAKEAAQSAFNAAKAALEINSPSRLFRREIGYRLPQGEALGIYDGIPLVKRAIDSLSDATTSTFHSRLRLNTQLQTTGGTGSGAGFGRTVIVNQYIYSEAKTAADLMQEARYQAETAVLFGV